MSDENETVDLRDLLNKPGSDFPDRPELPASKTFFGRLTSIEYIRSSRKQTPGLKFNVKFTDAGEDVPESWLENIKAAGFNLGDFTAFYEFWLTPNAMSMNWRAWESMGFSRQTGTRESFALEVEEKTVDGETVQDLKVTSESQEIVRGIPVMCKTAPAGDNGRVFPRLDVLVGVKKGG